MRKTAVVLVALLAVRAHRIAAQGNEVEPNAPCSFAQMLGEVALPYTLAGGLDALSPEGDVDFYAMTLTPGAGIEVTLEGLQSGQGTLHDPFLGLFDATCSLVRLNDDDRSSSDSKVRAIVPEDGIVVVAATSCCDYTFQGEVGNGGSYQLRVVSRGLAGGIRGRLVDATTLAPLPGDTLPYARLQLYACAGQDCSEWLESTSTNQSGEFEFTTDYRGSLLLAGTYLVRFDASLYEDGATAPFDVGHREDESLGDLALVPLGRIGSISGRVVDSITGAPLTGGSLPFSRITLLRCDDDDCFQFEERVELDDVGRFRFEGSSGNRAIGAGVFRLEAEADEYRTGLSEPFSVDFDQHVVLDDLPIEPYPVHFTEVRPCADLPSQGGICRFSLRVANRIDRQVEGSAWSIVESFSTGSLQRETRFQAGFPRRMSLGPGESRTARFRFSVPDSVQDGATMCGEVFFGLGRAEFRFDAVAHRFVFCIQKGSTGSFRVLTKKEVHELGVRKR